MIMILNNVANLTVYISDDLIGRPIIYTITWKLIEIFIGG